MLVGFSSLIEKPKELAELPEIKLSKTNKIFKIDNTIPKVRYFITAKAKIKLLKRLLKLYLKKNTKKEYMTLSNSIFNFNADRGGKIGMSCYINYNFKKQIGVEYRELDIKQLIEKYLLTL